MFPFPLFFVTPFRELNFSFDEEKNTWSINGSALVNLLLKNNVPEDEIPRYMEENDLNARIIATWYHEWRLETGESIDEVEKFISLVIPKEQKEFFFERKRQIH
jgi:hypothetical protein